MGNDTNVDKILDKLNYGEAKLYFSDECPACISQAKKLKLSFGDIEMAGGINCNNGECTDVNAVPTWVNKYGDHIVGSHSPSTLLKKLNTKQNKKLSFGRKTNFSTLNEQPQFYGKSTYCSVNGGSEPWSKKQLSVLKKDLRRVQKEGSFLGTMGFGENGPRLPRPFGPRDNSNMKGLHLAGSKLPPFDLDWNYKIGQFGKRSRKKTRKSKRSQKKTRTQRVKRKSRKRKSQRVKRKSRKFGANSTPGTKAWRQQTNKNIGLEWVNPKLKAAKGYNINSALLYLPIPDSQKISIPQDVSINIPRQFSNNKLNNPIPESKFGMAPLIQIESPNNVGYQKGLNLYDGAGANTINWATGKTFRHQGPKLRSVKKMPNNPRGWLSNTKGITEASSGFNDGRTYTRKGLRYRSFGSGDIRKGIRDNLVFTRNLLQSNAKTIYQPKPPYMDQKVTGSYANYGRSTSDPKKKKKKKSSTRKKRSIKKLKTQFGGKVITLDPKGKITITKPAK